MRSNRIFTMLAIAALPALGCGADLDDVAPAQSALLNGQTTSARPEVAQFKSPTGNACSATLISKRTFVTAANCLNRDWMDKGGTLTVAGVPMAVERTMSQGYLYDDDLAYGRLTAPASVTPAAIATTEPGAGWITAIGFGCMTNTCTPPAAKNYMQYWYNGSTPSSINQAGDAGGAVFAGLLADNGALVRVAGGRDPVSPYTDYGVDTIRYRSFIQAMDTAYNNDGISYRAQVQNNGWMQAVQNGNTAGTTNQSLRLEGLQIWSPRAGVNVCYSAYVQNIGWQQEVCDGLLAGTVSQSLRMEAIKIRLAAKPAGTNGVKYNTYLQGIGWQGWMQDNVVAGTTNQSRRIEAIAIQLY